MNKWENNDMKENNNPRAPAMLFGGYWSEGVYEFCKFCPDKYTQKCLIQLVGNYI